MKNDNRENGLARRVKIKEVSLFFSLFSIDLDGVFVFASMEREQSRFRFFMIFFAFSPNSDDYSNLAREHKKDALQRHTKYRKYLLLTSA